MYGTAHAFQTYQQTRVATASGGQLIVLAYEGALKWIARARHELAQDKPNLEQAHQAFVRAQDIIGELQGALRMEEGGEVASNLYQLYDFILDRLMQANLKKSDEGLEEVVTILRELLDAWKQISSPSLPTQPGQPTLQAVSSPAGGTRPSLNISG